MICNKFGQLNLASVSSKEINKNGGQTDNRWSEKLASNLNFGSGEL